MKITPEHIKLAKRLFVQWQDCEYGAPEIDPKRPYGNSDVEGDITEILGWRVRDELSEAQSKKAATLHREMLGVIRLALSNSASLIGMDLSR